MKKVSPCICTRALSLCSKPFCPQQNPSWRNVTSQGVKLSVIDDMCNVRREFLKRFSFTLAAAAIPNPPNAQSPGRSRLHLVITGGNRTRSAYPDHRKL